MTNNLVGLGDSKAKVFFYIKNRPPLIRYQNLTVVKVLVADEVSAIARETGNHWRKIFNVYAKLLFEITPKEFSSWQKLRDHALLQANSENCLLFSPPNISALKSNRILHVILGKGYGEELGLAGDCTWLSHDFAINTELGIIICPYFDYRQLSNIKITQLARLIQQLTT